MKHTPHPTDVHVGAQLAAFRKVAGKSQQKLAEHLGVTFQQVQKYEKGTNRIAPSRLFLAAELLGVQVQDFFPPRAADGEASPDGTFAFAATPEGVELIRLFGSIPDAAARRKLVAIVRATAEAVA